MGVPLHLAASVVIVLLYHAEAIWAGAPLPNSVAGLDPAVQSVMSGGYWSNRDGEGFVRAVVVADGVEHVRASLYLQWISVDSRTGSAKVLATVPVTEVDTPYAGERVVDIRKQEDAEFGTFHLSIAVSLSAPDRVMRFDLEADGPLRTYRIEKIQ